jgi:multimeric flavodoxin WrbA
MDRVLVIYQSFSGNTQKMAEAVAAGAREVRGVEVVLKRASEAGSEDLGSASAVAFGAPNTFGGMSGALRDFFDRAWGAHEAVAGRPAVAFSSENADVTAARQEIEKFFTFYKLKKLSEGVTAVQSPGPKELEACQALGRELAKAALH